VTSAALATVPAVRPVAIRPAPRREPPFDDELPEPVRLPGRYDRRLPFELAPAPPVLWRARPAPPRGLPDPALWARRLLVGLIETAGGRRPLHQLAAMLSPSVGRGLGGDFDRATQHGARHWLHRATVRTVRVTEPAPGVAELCATLDTGPRVRALAMRLEEHHGRWSCTRLQLG
jgi:Family of unknown function (DUF6459)